MGPPLNGTLEIAGSKRFRLGELIQLELNSHNDPKEVVIDANAPYSGAILSDLSLVPGDGAWLGESPFEDWLSHSTVQK